MDQSSPLSVSSSYPFYRSFVHDPLSLNRAGGSTSSSSSSAGGVDQGIRSRRAHNFAKNGFIRYPSLCSDVDDDDPRPYPQLFAGASEETPEAPPSIPCALFWTLHFCLSVNALKEFRRENEALRQDLGDEIKRHRKTLANLDAMRFEMEEKEWELEMAKEKAETEARRCEGAHERLEQMMGRMKREAILRMKWEREMMAKEGSRRMKEMEKAVAEERRLRMEAEGKAAEERRLRREAEGKAAEERMWRLEEEERAAEERRLRREAEGKAEEERRLRDVAEMRAFEAKLQRIEAEAALKKAVVEYSVEELRSATDSFHEANRIRQAAAAEEEEDDDDDDDDEYWGSLYKGTCQGVPVSVRVLLPLLLQENQESEEEEEEEEARTSCFRQEVAFWSRIHHPHIVTLLGACTDKPCLVYEHMDNGNLQSHLSGRAGTPPLPWHVRFRICSELAAAVRFLHSLPETVAHGSLNLKNVFLDHNLVCKIGDVGMNKLLQALSRTAEDDDVNLSRINQESDVQALGVIMLQLLSGLPSDVVVEEVDRAIDSNELQGTLDVSAGEWPLVETMELACLGLQLAERRNDMMAMMMETMEKIRACAEEGAARERLIIISVEEEEPSRRGQQHPAPNHFMCPISQEIMENPCIAADGFCYDEDHIRAWLANHNTSPMTNLRLDHLNLTPNIPLRAAIREWCESSR